MTYEISFETLGETIHPLLPCLYYYIILQICFKLSFRLCKSKFAHTVTHSYNNTQLYAKICYKICRIYYIYKNQMFERRRDEIQSKVRNPLQYQAWSKLQLGWKTIKFNKDNDLEQFAKWKQAPFFQSLTHLWPCRFLVSSLQCPQTHRSLSVLKSFPAYHCQRATRAISKIEFYECVSGQSWWMN